jgi:hypothetical protein
MKYLHAWIVRAAIIVKMVFALTIGPHIPRLARHTAGMVSQS